MKKLHYHSDCPFFAGCENMLVNFLQDEKLNAEYKITFSYRYSQRYKEGMDQRIKKKISEYPL